MCTGHRAKVAIFAVCAFLAVDRSGSADDPSPPDEKSAQIAAAVEQFETKVRPVLAERCWKCHGREKSEANLRLDSAAAVGKGGDSGSVVVPNNPDESHLIQAILQTGDLKMPPDEKLSDAEIAELVAWVKDGAVWPESGKVASIGSVQTPIEPLPPNHETLAPHLQLWLKADALAAPDVGRVTVWPDQSGHGRDLSVVHAVEGSATAPAQVQQSTVNRRPAVRFEKGNALAGASDDAAKIAGDAGLTLFVVGNFQSDGAAQPSDSAAASEPVSFEHVCNRPLLLTVIQTPDPTSPIVKAYFNGEPSEFEPFERNAQDGRALLELRLPFDARLLLGPAAVGSAVLLGDVAEVIIYSTSLPDDQRQAVEAHLAEKYAIVLPSQLSRTVATFSDEQRSFWSFQPVADPQPPDVQDMAWVRSTIDRFVLAKLEQHNLKPAPAASKPALLRRVTFDLIGLPPTPEEIEAFVKDESPEAFEKVVNRLLDSPHYGERWGRHWLDVVRYADTTANDANAVMRYAYRYRNYVVDAFNRDLPYDQFIIEQLAGDLLPPSTDINLQARRTIATGFLMLGPKALAETDKEQTRMDVVDEQIDVTGRALLGLTLACARCHDHKFDPIPTLDYYGLAGIFRGTEAFKDEVRNATMFQEWSLFQPPGEKPFMVMAPKEALPVNLRVHVRGNRFNLGQLAPRRFPQIVAEAGFESARSTTAPLPLRGEVGSGVNLPNISTLQQYKPEAQASESPHGMEGWTSTLRESIALRETTQSGRLELANWIASPNNPLTARVMVNRVWQHHFGTGLVATADNFGARGEPPSHPDLLDWLASRFIESGWSVKAMHRLMLLTSTYQMQSTPNDAALAIDPDNRLLWRMPHRRLEAEELRDAMLAVSGQMDRTIGGGEAGIVLAEQSEAIDAERGFIANRVQSDNPCYDVPRRSIYLPVVRNALPDVLALFDAADPYSVTAVRNETTVPSQTLFLMNNPFVRAQANHFAAQLLGMADVSDLQRVQTAFLKSLGRPPSEEELAEADTFLNDYVKTAPSDRPPEESQKTAWQSYCQMLFCLNEFIYVE